MKRGAEFSVYQGGSPARRPPNPPPDNLNLRVKQRSLTNLTLLSDGEQRVYSFELDDTQPRISKPHNSSSSFSPSSLQGSPRKEVVTRGGTRTRSLSLSLTKMLSQSEHSLIPVPWRCTGGRKERASYSGHSRTESARTSREVEEKEEEGGSNEEGKKRGKKDDGDWAEEEVSEGGRREGAAQLDKELILTMLGDLEQVLHTETRPREDPEARRMRTVKNIADLRQNLEETMSSLRGTQITHSTIETTFDTTVTTEVNGRSLPALTTRSSPMAWRLGQSQTPRLQAGDAPSMPGSYAAAPRATTTSAGCTTGRYTGHSDTSRYLTDGGLHLYSRSAGRASDSSTSQDVSQKGSKETQGDIDR
ncbi:Neuron navigator 3 [Dissostichus eleginoides]|uniref:Neuron navigator 3 n=1 Tax=Dissostichus eleginoides TaxID=100907 RepID=A0AAD9CQ41_DISEL|nr:Neuron navigator 3 [Dissostichus eleginoides]